MSITAGIFELQILLISKLIIGKKYGGDVHIQEDHECLVINGILDRDYGSCYSRG